MMTLFSVLLLVSFMIGTLSIIYKKAFFLSILVSLEILILNIIMFNIFISLSNGNLSLVPISVFIFAFAAVEASIGVSIITLISRSFSNNNITSLSTLKN